MLTITLAHNNQEGSMDVDGSDRGHPAINKIRNRDLALRAFVPCALWIIKREGIEEGKYPGSSATLPGNIVLHLACIGAHHFALSIHADVKGRRKKVFSAKVTSMPTGLDPNAYRNCEGCVRVVSWRRGEWENVVLVECFEHDSEGFWEVLDQLVTLH
jgi:hypothetical protein